MKQDIFYTVMSLIFVVLLIGFVFLEYEDRKLRKQLGQLKHEQHKTFLQRNGMPFLFGFLAYENFDSYFITPIPFYLISFLSFLVIAVIFFLRGLQKKGLYDKGFVCNKEIPWLWKDMESGVLMSGKKEKVEILWTPKNRCTWHQRLMRRPLLVLESTQVNLIKKICKMEKITLNE